MNILVHSANENAKQNALSSAYNASFDPETEVDPKSLILFDEESGAYDFIVTARYPHVYKRNGIQSVICYKCSQAIVDLIDSLPNSISVLAFDDNNPDNDYIWESPSGEAKFLSVVGGTFFSGEGSPGDEDYIAPRKKLCILM
jgi:hypothetical protein